MFETIKLSCACGAALRFTGESYRLDTTRKEWIVNHKGHMVEGTQVTLVVEAEPRDV